MILWDRNVIEFSDWISPYSWSYVNGLAVCLAACVENMVSLQPQSQVPGSHNPMISTEFKSPATHHMTSIPFYVHISGTTSHESNDSGTHQSLKCFLWDVLHVNFLLQHFPRQGVSLPWYMYFWVIYSFTFSIKLLFIKLSLCPR